MNTPASGAIQRDKLLILAAICLAALVLPLAFSGGAVATPAIGRDLGAHASLAHVVPEGADIVRRIGEAAQRVTAGDMIHAAAVLPEVPRAALAASYADAFTRLLHALIVITLLAACATFAFLSRTGAQDEGDGAEATTEATEEETAEDDATAIPG